MTRAALAAALLIASMAAPAVASAPVAAGTMPNTFDRPAGSTAAPTPSPVPGPPPAPADEGSGDALRDVIAAGQAGTIDYSKMTDGLAAQMRAQEAQAVPLLQSFGAVQAVDFVRSEDDIDYFAVTFANAATLWGIGLTDDGKISALLFRPAE